MTQGEREPVAEIVKRHRSGCGISFYGELAQLAKQLERALNDANADCQALAWQLTQVIRERDELRETVKVLSERLAEVTKERDDLMEKMVKEKEESFKNGEIFLKSLGISVPPVL